MTTSDPAATSGRRRGLVRSRSRAGAVILLAACAALAACSTGHANAGQSHRAAAKHPARVAASGGDASGSQVAATSTTRWALSWDSDFAKPGALNKWFFQIGGGTNGWGLNQLQWYDKNQATVNKQGQLVISLARGGSHNKCWYGPCKFTSARMETLGHFSQTYGKFEARIWFPPGPGIWPAFWLEGTNITRVGWPQCGEIDVDEPFNRNTHLVLGYAHTKKIRWRARLTVSKPTTAGFHTYGITWTPKGISWTFDGHTYSAMKATPGWGFNHRFFMILNVAIGGNYPGPISKTNKYPSEMIVAWVKVYHQVHTTSAAN